jgi:hypothetical protein
MTFDPAQNMKRKREKFLPEEDEKLRFLVSKYGSAAWNAIAAELPGRNVRQCRERWKHYLSGLRSKDFWSPEESRLLFEKMESIGPRWTKLAAYFPGRTDIQIKTYWMQNFARFSNLHIMNRTKKLPEFKPTLEVKPEPPAAEPAPPPAPAITFHPAPRPSATAPEEDLFKFSRDSSMGSRSFSDLWAIPE